VASVSFKILAFMLSHFSVMVWRRNAERA